MAIKDEKQIQKDELIRALRIQLKDALYEECETKMAQHAVTEMLCEGEKKNHSIRLRLENCTGDIGEEAIRRIVPVVWDYFIYYMRSLQL